MLLVKIHLRNFVNNGQEISVELKKMQNFKDKSTKANPATLQTSQMESLNRD